MTALENKKSQESIDKIHAKYYGNKKSKVAKTNAKITKAVAEKKAEKKAVKKGAKQAGAAIAAPKAPAVGKTAKVGGDPRCLLTRDSLMKQAQAAGIKYFRILTKDELGKVLDLHASGLQDEINQITDAAQKRWKAGWGHKGGQPEGSTKATSHPKADPKITDENVPAIKKARKSKKGKDLQFQAQPKATKEAPTAAADPVVVAPEDQATPQGAEPTPGTTESTTEQQSAAY